MEEVPVWLSPRIPSLTLAPPSWLPAAMTLFIGLGEWEPDCDAVPFFEPFPWDVVVAVVVVDAAATGAGGMLLPPPHSDKRTQRATRLCRERERYEGRREKREVKRCMSIVIKENGRMKWDEKRG